MDLPSDLIDLLSEFAAERVEAYSTRQVFQVSGQPVVCVGKTELIA